MSLLLVIEGDFGQPIVATLKDADTGQAADVSGYTSAQVFLFKKPDGTIVQKTATFVTDGSDGKIQYTTESGFFTDGYWEILARVTSGTARLTSQWKRFKVHVEAVVS